MAIARDAIATAGTIASGDASKSWSHAGGSPTVATVTIWEGNNDHVTSVTYGGTTMTLGKKNVTVVGGRMSIYYLPNPASGTQTVVLNKSTGDGARAESITYTGTDTTSAVLGATAVLDNASAASPQNISITLTGTGSWLLLAQAGDVSAATGATGGGATFTDQDGSGNKFFWDSNGTVTTGAQTVAVTFSPNSGISSALIELRVPQVSGPTNLKSYNTNVKSNIKSINTNALANIKSLDTNV